MTTLHEHFSTRDVSLVGLISNMLLADSSKTKSKKMNRGSPISADDLTLYATAVSFPSNIACRRAVKYSAWASA